MQDSLQTALRIAASGLQAQSTRLRVVSQNIANAQSTGKNLLSMAYPNKEFWEPPTPVTLAPGENKVIDVPLRTGGQISGTVRSAATGAPAAL